MRTPRLRKLVADATALRRECAQERTLFHNIEAVENPERMVIVIVAMRLYIDGWPGPVRAGVARPGSLPGEERPPIILYRKREDEKESMEVQAPKKTVLTTSKEYLIITASIMIMVVGIHFFKFPNNFSFGGVTGFASVVSALTHWSATGFTNAVNLGLLILGFLFLGRDFGFKTVYATLVMSGGLELMEKLFPLSAPLTSEPLLELMFAIFLPAVGSAVLFNIGASSGGTDIIAMIFKKHTSLHIGTMLLLVDMAAVVMSFFVFGPATGMFSSLGLLAKSLVIDQVIENMNQCKCFTIVCDDADPICDFIINDLDRSATVYEAKGAFSHHEKQVIMTTMKSAQAVKLRNYIRQVEPSAFIQITNSSEIIGKGFLGWS